MAEVIFLIGIITIFVTFLLAVSFPAVTTQIYSVIQSFLTYISSSTGIIWMFVPKDYTLMLLNLVIAVELIIRGYKIFMFIYAKIRG